MARASSAMRFLLLIFLVGLVIGLVYAAPKLGWADTDVWSSIFGRKEIAPTYSTFKVVKGDLLVTVLEDGNLESSSNIDIKCQVAGGSSILTIVKDGTMVKKGDKLVELDSSALDEQINSQRIVYEKARASSIQAEKDFEVAKISVKEYLEGTYRKELQIADSNITIALENLKSSQNALEHSQRMFRKGYVSTLELESQQFAVQRAQLELEAQKTTKDVLERFTKLKMLEDLESKVATAEAKMKSEAAALDLEEAKLKRLEEQLKHCQIIAPADGMVVYANEQSGGRFGGQQAATIEEGASVRERQTILRLPDLSKMQVKVNVHESKVEQLRPGLRARVRILDRELQGTVYSIANQPEPTSFFSPSVKEYATIVRIDGEPEGLKPGMTAEVEILIAHLKDVYSLPVASVVEQRGTFLCWAKSKSGNGLEKRQLLAGLTNDQFIEVKDGVQEGDEIVLNPRAVIAGAQEETSEKAATDVEKKFGKSSGEAAGAPPAGGPVGGGKGREPGMDDGANGAASGPGPGGPGVNGGPGGGKGGSKGKGGGRGLDVMQFDKDGDGKVSRDEAPEQMSSFFDRIDTNGDGFIDRAEAAAMRARAGGGGQGGGGPGGPGGPPGGGGEPGGPGANG